MVISKAGEESGGPSFLETPSHQSPPTRRNWPPAAERSLPLETVPGTLEASSPRPSPARGMFFLSPLIVHAHPDPSYPKLLYQGPQIKCLTGVSR